MTGLISLTLKESIIMPKCKQNQLHLLTNKEKIDKVQVLKQLFFKV